MGENIDHHPFTSFDELKPAEYNPRTISENAFHGLKKSMTDFGDLSGITWNKKTGNLVCGHQRVRAAQSIGGVVKDGSVCIESTGEVFDVRVVDWPIEKERVANVVANNPHIAGVFTSDVGAIVQKIKDGINRDDFIGLMLNKVKPSVVVRSSVHEDDVPTVDGVVCEAGDIWSLGKHTLFCGACQEMPATHDGKIDLLVTDPPYGVSYADKKISSNTHQIQNDGGSSEEMVERWRLWFGSVVKRLRPGAAYYVFGPFGDLLLDFISSMHASGMPVRQQLVWDKGMIVIGRSDYQYSHEPIFYGWTPGKHHRVVDRTQKSVWSIPKPTRSKMHPTTKPVELYVRAIENSSDVGSLVYDAFGGSGTCVIACEQTNRTCITSEIDLFYCSTIIKRWEDLTGLKAVKNA